MTVTKHNAFLGDGEKSFCLTPELIFELERTTDSAIGTIYSRFMGMQFRFLDIIEIIRLGLIGGGMEPKAAYDLVEAYIKPRPLMQSFPIAFSTLELAWNGEPAATDEAAKIVTTIDDALKEVAA